MKRGRVGGIGELGERLEMRGAREMKEEEIYRYKKKRGGGSKLRRRKMDFNEFFWKRN